MDTGRTTLSFLDLALLLLSAFAYAHFFNMADGDGRKNTVAGNEPKPVKMGSYNYATSDFFGTSNAMLTEYAKKEIADALTEQQHRLLIVEVGAARETQRRSRLNQWEVASARTAAIAEEFEAAGQDGTKIVLKVPDKLVSVPPAEQKIKLTFLSGQD